MTLALFALMGKIKKKNKTKNGPQAGTTLINEHGWYKTSKASLREGQHRRGQTRLVRRRPGLPEGSGRPRRVDLCHVGSEESLSRGDLTTPPEAGAGTLEVSTCDLKP